jgi:uncharacterized membrane protein
MFAVFPSCECFSSSANSRNRGVRVKMLVCKTNRTPVEMPNFLWLYSREHAQSLFLKFLLFAHNMVQVLSLFDSQPFDALEALASYVVFIGNVVWNAIFR